MSTGTHVDGAVVLKGLTKEFRLRRPWPETILKPFRRKTLTAVDDVSFAVSQGGFFGLLGPNGAGKTTMFKMLSTLLLPNAGTAEILGYDLLRQPETVRTVLTPVIADERSLYWRVSNRANLRLFAALHGLKGGEATRRVDEVLEVVGLATLDDRMVGTYSSGMKQRLLVARALLARPRVLLLDEPTRSLDPITAREMRRFLREELVDRHGCTVLLATHNTDEVVDLCDEVGILHRGRLLAKGKVEELAERFGNRQFVLRAGPEAHPVLEQLQGQGALASLSQEYHGGDWATFGMTISGGPEGASEVIQRIVESGSPVASFERMPVPLAELLERVIQREGGGARA